MYARLFVLSIGILFSWGIVGSAVDAAQLVMKDGRNLQGKMGTLPELGADLQAAMATIGTDFQAIVFLDDDLRRTYVPRFQIANVNRDDPLEVLEKINLTQRVRSRSNVIMNVGKLYNVQPFDEFGRRTVDMKTPSGAVSIVQGITEMTPIWTKVEGITHTWDMRMATSNLPSASLNAILMNQARDTEGIKKIARFYIQGQRFKNAQALLDLILKDPKTTEETREQLEPTARLVKQMEARQLLDELNVYAESGQYKFVYSLLEQFPTEGVSSEILQQVRKKLQDAQALDQRRADLLAKMKTLYDQIEDPQTKAKTAPIIRDIVLYLNPNTMERLASFSQGYDDNAYKPQEKLALALSGWLLGTDGATTNLANCLSAFQVRELIREYLNEPDAIARKNLLAKFKSQEAAAVPTVAKILANGRPPVLVPAPSQITEDFFRMSCANMFTKTDVEYFVQLPPEYDPMRRYPAILALHDDYATPESQIDWWAGEVNEQGKRLGLAGRNGFIVIAPVWTTSVSKKYDYSGAVHGAVLATLHDACRHFSIDTDRVFLTGQSNGGAAAWDIAMAHPDLWAGVIPIGAMVDKFPIFYWNNARYMPLYFICGQLDGNLLMTNSKTFNKYIMRMYDLTVVEYIGRGHENFRDEIFRLMDWMKRKKRDFFPEKFECKTMRAWDNFFWWAELNNLPPKTLADPLAWPPPKGTAPSLVSGTVNAKAAILLRTAAEDATIWLSPNLVDFDQKISILFNGRKLNNSLPYIEPDLEVLLEDVRTRGDRQNPFWAKYEIVAGRPKK